MYSSIAPLTFCVHHSYNMIGHSKFCITLLGGVVLFHDPVSLNQMLGIGLVILGISLYTYLKIQNQKQTSQQTTSAPKQSI